MFLSRLTESQAGHDGKTVVIDWFWKIAELTNISIAYFLWSIYFHEIWKLSILGVYLFSQMSFKQTFCKDLILRNRPKFTKFTQICKVEN